MHLLILQVRQQRTKRLTTFILSTEFIRAIRHTSSGGKNA